MNDMTVVYLVMATEISGESWVHAVCKTDLTAQEACDKMNSERQRFDAQYFVEECELYD